MGISASDGIRPKIVIRKKQRNKGQPLVSLGDASGIKNSKLATQYIQQFANIVGDKGDGYGYTIDVTVDKVLTKENQQNKQIEQLAYNQLAGGNGIMGNKLTDKNIKSFLTDN